LFESEQAGAVELDVAGAEKYKADVDEKIAALEAEAAKLTGKDNKKERAAKGKEVAELKGEARYVDACKVAKGLEPKNGHFAKFPEPVKKAAPAPAPELEPEAKSEPKKKDEKKAKKQESAGISPAETKEMEQLKKDIVARKEQLKAEGLSGGQQNKDAQIVAWVTRLNELKEKQEPGSTQKEKKEGKKSSRAPLSSQEQIEMDKLKGEIEEYKHRLRTEFGYGPKDMKADPDLKDMEAKMAAFEKRS